MLLAHIAKFSGKKKWGGDFTLLLAAQALHITVKMVSPIDQKSRKQYDAQRRKPPNGTGRKGDNSWRTTAIRASLPLKMPRLFTTFAEKMEQRV